MTHDPRAAAYADCVVFLRDGQKQHDIRFHNQQDREQRLHMLVQMLEEAADLEETPPPWPVHVSRLRPVALPLPTRK